MKLRTVNTDPDTSTVLPCSLSTSYPREKSCGEDNVERIGVELEETKFAQSGEIADMTRAKAHLSRHLFHTRNTHSKKEDQSTHNRLRYCEIFGSGSESDRIRIRIRIRVRVRLQHTQYVSGD